MCEPRGETEAARELKTIFEIREGIRRGVLLDRGGAEVQVGDGDAFRVGELPPDGQGFPGQLFGRVRVALQQRLLRRN